MNVCDGAGWFIITSRLAFSEDFIRVLLCNAASVRIRAHALPHLEAPYAAIASHDGAHRLERFGSLRPGVGEVLGIAADLTRLEEKLLYPSNTQLAIFVSVTPGPTFRLDAIQIKIDGQLATHYIYSFKELDALQHGGVQRIYTGNVPTGAHQVVVSVNGKTDSGKDFNRDETFGFDKGVEPKLLGITLAGPDTIQLGNWN